MEMRAKFMEAPVKPQHPKKNGTTRKKPHCCFCTNHKKHVSTQQHRCIYKEKCTCILCRLTKKAQVIMCHQQRVWRYQNQQLNNQRTTINGQKCDNCRNHFLYVKKSNHDCPRKDCECDLCKLTFKRREIMKYIQRARRLNITLESNVTENAEEQNSAEEPVGKQHNSLNREMTTLCNDTDVDMLVSATNSFTIDCQVTTPCTSPSEPKLSPASPVAPRLHCQPLSTQTFVPSPNSGNNVNGEIQEGVRTKSPSELKSSENYCFPYDPTDVGISSKNLLYHEKNRENNPLEAANASFKRRNITASLEDTYVRKYPPLSSVTSQFVVQQPNLLSSIKEEDMKSTQFSPSQERNLMLPLEGRSHMTLGDSHCCRNPPSFPILNESQPLSGMNPVNPYSPFEFGRYHTPSLLHPSFVEQAASRQAVHRPIPIIPYRTNRPNFLLNHWILGSLNNQLQGLFPHNYRDPTTHTPAFPPSNYLKAMYSRQSVDPMFHW